MSLFQGVYCDEWCINLSWVNPWQLWVWADDAQGPKSDKPLESHLEIAASWGAIQIQFPVMSVLKSLSFHHVLSLDVLWWQYIKHSFLYLIHVQVEMCIFRLRSAFYSVMRSHICGSGYAETLLSSPCMETCLPPNSQSVLAQAVVSVQEVQQIPKQGLLVWGWREGSSGGPGLTLYLH